MSAISFRLLTAAGEGGELPGEDSEYNHLLPEFWIVEGRNIPWDCHTITLSALFDAEASLVLFEPWWPGSKRKKELFRATWGLSVEDLEGTLLSCVGQRQNRLSVVFDVWHQCGGPDSGQWLIAQALSTCDRLASKIRTAPHSGPAVFVATAVADELQSAIALDEAGMSTLFVRRTHPHFPTLLKLLEDL